MRATPVIEREASYLVTWFRAFYNEVIRVKQAIQMGVPIAMPHASAFLVETPVPATNALTAYPEEEGLMQRDETLDRVLAVRQRLLNALERQENAAEKIGGEHSFQRYKLAQYVMAALADEVMLNLDWKGSLLWNDHLLEAKLFQSAAAGDRFFDLVDHLLQERDAGTVDLAKVCMMALVLDFQGRYRSARDLTPLATYRDALYAFVARHDAGLDPNRPVLMPEAYTSTLGDGFAEMLPNPRRWIWVLVLVSLTLFTISWAVWDSLVSRLEIELNQIQQADALIFQYDAEEAGADTTATALLQTTPSPARAWLSEHGWVMALLLGALVLLFVSFYVLLVRPLRARPDRLEAPNRGYPSAAP